MFRSEDVILVTRDGAPAGFYLPWDTPDVPVEVRREVFLRLSEQVGAQLVEQRARRDDDPFREFEKWHLRRGMKRPVVTKSGCAGC